MEPFWLRLRAPFGAFRWLQAGVYRATSPTIPPSAAWGLVLNLAGIETRDRSASVVTQRKAEVPSFRVAIGELRRPEVNSLYQQLHGYPVGSSGQELAGRSRGSKYWIAPVRREILRELDLQIGVEGAELELRDRVEAGLRGEHLRYGLPFLGDNNFLIDRVDIAPEPVEAHWYCRLDGNESGPARGTTRLTVDIDREDSAKTRTSIYQRTVDRCATPPESAWTWVPKAPSQEC